MMTDDPSSPSRRRFFGAVATLAALAALPLPVRAAPAVPAPLSPQQRAEVARVQDYLNNIKTLKSRFQQFAADGGVATGTIYLQRPGKMRIIYDDPVPILIVADGSTVYYWDKNLQQLSQVNVDDTPAWFLLRPQIRLTGDVTIIGFEHKDDVVRIAMTETQHPGQGSLTVVMGEHPLELRQWTVIDAQRKPVTVSLVDPQYNIALDPNLFFWTRQTAGPASH